MKLRLGAVAGPLVIVSVAVIAIFSLTGCDGGSSGPDGPIPTDQLGTPISFTTVRDDLASQLDNIGANIGAVPDDVRQQLLVQCQQLSYFASPDEVTPLCTAIGQAIDRSDPGLVDNIVESLRALKEE